MSTATDIAPLVRERSIVVCCGSGGAGKTTTAAAVALAGAMAGRKACVVTIDPARRLADALGIGTLSNDPKVIPGPWPGELWAVMLDAKSTFDSLIERYSSDPEQVERILNNRLYRNLTSALSGTQEYMASEKLYELNESGLFDLVVVDTPPTRNALDFLDAPARLMRFLDNRIFKIVLMPTRASLKAISFASQTLLKTISKVAGSEIVDDAVAFFRAFEGMEDGFRDRAAKVAGLLEDPGTAFVLVAAPRRDSVEEARFFAERLSQAHQPVAALIVNRLHPDFAGGEVGADGGAGVVGKAAGVSEADGGEGAGPIAVEVSAADATNELAALRNNLADLQSVANRERHYLLGLEERVEGIVVRVPYLERDVHDLDGLTRVAGYLTGQLLSDRD